MSRSEPVRDSRPAEDSRRDLDRPEPAANRSARPDDLDEAPETTAPPSSPREEDAAAVADSPETGSAVSRTPAERETVATATTQQSALLQLAVTATGKPTPTPPGQMSSGQPQNASTATLPLRGLEPGALQQLAATASMTQPAAVNGKPTQLATSGATPATPTAEPGIRTNFAALTGLPNEVQVTVERAPVVATPRLSLTGQTSIAPTVAALPTDPAIAATPTGPATPSQSTDPVLQTSPTRPATSQIVAANAKDAGKAFVAALEQSRQAASPNDPFGNQPLPTVTHDLAGRPQPMPLQSFAAVGQTAPSELPRPALPVDQVAVQLHRAIGSGRERISIQLHPAELGRVDVKLELGQDGPVRAVISVDRPETMELLQRDARGLERTLQDAGLKTDSSSLSFDLRGENHERSQRQEQGDSETAAGNGDQSGELDGEVVGAPADRERWHDGQVSLQA